MKGLTRRQFLWILIVALSLIGCGTGEGAPALPDTFPAAGDTSSWTPEGDVQTFDEETLFNLVNGQADVFFAYGFEQVAVRRYVGADEAAMHVEVWQLATPADAYGLFTLNASGAPVEGIGSDSDADPGRRLSFWQDRYFASVRALQATDNADLETFARHIASALPAGGNPPDLLDRLPSDGLTARPYFFHEEIAIQDVLWLGGENLLDLGPETDGVLAQYDIDGVVTYLLLIEYPDAASASTGLEALESGAVAGLAAANAEENVLGAVFGEVDKAAIDPLLEKALK